MTTPPFSPAGTPYVTNDQLTLGYWPLAVDFTTLPPGTNVTTTQKQAALAAVCEVATSQVNSYLNYPPRAILNTETLPGPDFRVTVRRNTGVGRVILSRWPVTNIVSVKVAPMATMGPSQQWTTVPAGSWTPEYPVIGRFSSNVPTGSGEGGQAILIAPSYINWCYGRDGYQVQVQYYHGWPHTALSAAAAAGATSIQVGDCTAWAPFAAGSPGAEGTVRDPAGGEEAVSVTASTATTGPGTLTLSSGLAYAHLAGVMLSSLPTTILWASAEFAAADALSRGAQAMVNAAAPGRSAGGNAKTELKEHAMCTLDPYKRTW